MNNITNLINLKREKIPDNNNKTNQNIFQLTLSDIILSLLFCLKKNNNCEIIALECISKKSQLKLILIYRNQLFLYAKNKLNILCINKNSLFFKESLTTKFKPITKENEHFFFREIYSLLEEDKSCIPWFNEETLPESLLKIDHKKISDNTTTILIENNFKKLTNKSKTFDTYVTAYFFSILKRNQNKIIIHSLNKIQEQFKLILNQEKAHNLRISNSTDTMKYTINIKKNKVDLKLNTFNKNNHIILDFDSYEIIVNDKKEELIYFIELNSFFKQLNLDISSNKIKFVKEK